MGVGYEILKYTHDKHPEAHIHEYYEIFVSLSSDGKLFVKEKGYDLHFGTMFFLMPLDIHRCFCRGNRDYNRYVIHFTQEYLQSISTETTNLVARFNSAPLMQQIPDDKLISILGKLSALLNPDEESYGSDIERNINFNSFLLSVARLINENGMEPTTVVKSEMRVNDILRYIHENYEKNITLDDLSNIFYISKSRLSQIFKDSTGFSVGEYIITYRIKRACTLLRRGVSTQDVGRQVGFHNSAHFIRMFKKHTGYSPGQFSKEQRDGLNDG